MSYTDFTTKFGNQIFNEDCRQTMKKIPANSIHTVITSPPFWSLRDYDLAPQIWGGSANCQHEWSDGLAAGNSRSNDSSPGDKQETNVGSTGRDNRQQSNYCIRCSAWRGSYGLEPAISQYLANTVEIFREIRRILRPDGTAWLNLGDTYNAAGYSNHKNTGGALRVNGGKQKHTTNRKSFRRDHAEIIPSKRIPRGSGRWGGGNARNPNLKPKDLCGIPWKVAFALQEDGWWLRSALPWVKRAVMPGSERDRPTGSGSAIEYVFMLTKSPQYFFDMEAVRRKASGNSHAQGRRRRPGEALAGEGIKSNNSFNEATRNVKKEDLPQSRSYRPADLFFESIEPPHGLIWHGDEMVGLDINPEGYKEAHFATFGAKLVAPLIKMSTSERGCCSECGAPWVRMVEKPSSWSRRKERKPETEFTRRREDAKTNSRYQDGTTAKRLALLRQQARENGGEYVQQTKTVGWKPSCECDAGDPVPCIVYDPFMGSGTVSEVALRLGRRYIGSELSSKYIKLIEKRLFKYKQQESLF